MSSRRHMVLLPLLAMVACQSEPEPLTYLQVTSLNDAERNGIYERFSPLIQTGLGGPSVDVGQPIAVVSPGQAKATEPGPVVWEVQMTAVDTLSGAAYVIRLSEDSQEFVVEALEGMAHLNAEQAALAMQIAGENSDVKRLVDEARGLGYVVSPGAMAEEAYEECPGRCVDVRFVGVRHRVDGGHDTANMVNAHVSLGARKVVTINEPEWLR